MKVNLELIVIIIADSNRYYESENPKEIYSFCDLVLLKPFRYRDEIIEDYSCFYYSLAFFRKDFFFLSEIGLKPLDNIQEIAKVKRGLLSER